jgi:aspartate/methionine/tyrosine aminotransferase
VNWFAEIGILVTPGSFYGGKGNRYVRIALTASDENISSAASRIIAAINR